MCVCVWFYPGDNKPNKTTAAATTTTKKRVSFVGCPTAWETIGGWAVNTMVLDLQVFFVSQLQLSFDETKQNCCQCLNVNFIAAVESLVRLIVLRSELSPYTEVTARTEIQGGWVFLFFFRGGMQLISLRCTVAVKFCSQMDSDVNPFVAFLAIKGKGIKDGAHVQKRER